MTTVSSELAHARFVAPRSRGRYARALFASRSMHRLLAWPFAILVSAFMLQYSIYLIHWIVWDRVIKLTSLFGLIALFPYRGVPRKFRFTIALFAVLFVTAALGSIATLDMGGIVQLIKLVVGFLILPLVVLRFRPGDAPSPTLVKVLLFWGFLFSVQELALWTLVLQDKLPSGTLIQLERLENMLELNLGIFGYGNGLGWLYEGYYYFRPQGWFTEPSNLASFLLYPAFVAFGIFLTTRKLRFLFVAAVCNAGLLFTFSLAGYMAALAGIVMLIIVRPRRRRGPDRRWYFWVAPIVAAVAFLFVAQLVMRKTYEIYVHGSEVGYSRIARLLRRDPNSQRLVQPYYRVEETARLVTQHPLGIGLGNTMGFNVTTSMNAYVYWAVAGGFPAMILVLFLFGHLFYSYCLPLLMSRIAYYRYIAASFIAITVHALSYGSWVTPFYLFVVGLMIVASGHLEALRQEARTVPKE